MFRLDNKVALITGASGGIGQAIAKAFVKQGAKVVLSGTRENVLREVQTALGEENVFVQTANLKDLESLKALILNAEKQVNAPIDILVNSAGLTRDNLSIRMKESEWSEVLDVDLTVPFQLSQVALKGMIRRRFGRIINIASIIGFIGNIGQANYSAAKGGLIAMSKSLALEVAKKGVTINVVAPGFIETPMTAVLSEEQQSKLLQRIPSSRMGKAEEVAAAVVYLASDEAAWVTGTCLHVNGGMYMV